MNNHFSLIRKFTAVAAIFTMLAPALVLRAEGDPAARSLTEDQKILHVLNRLGFGARPGDVEKVKTMGLKKYIDRQLDPSSIDDPVAQSKVKDLDIFDMSTAELFAKYPNPGAFLRQIDGVKKAQPAAQDQKAPTVVPNGAVVPNVAAAQDPNEMTEAEKKERRERVRELYEQYDLKPAGQILPQIVANRVLRAVYSERQLQEVMVDFWQNHFNVFAGKAAVRWYIPSYERDVIRKNALGNFKDLLIGTAEHPAMLFYLDNFESVSPNAQLSVNAQNAQRFQQLIKSRGQITPQMRERIRERTGATDAQIDQRIKNTPPAKPAQKRGINENYARELMELHTLGVDGGYTQNDIIEVAKCFTGWTIADPQGYRRAAAAMIQGTEGDRRIERLQRQQGVPDNIESGEFYFNERWHEGGAKTVLGQKVDEGGIKDGLKVIDILVNQEATAKFIARKLAVKFVSDTPSEGLVSRVADAFHDSKGDIKTTLRALFSDKEFFAPENYRAKIKSPFELVVSSIRTLGGDTNASPAMVAMLNKLGEVPYGYQAPTGYPDTAEDWVNTGALLERLNFAVAIASNRIPGTRVDLKGFGSSDNAEILDKAISTILGDEISAATRATLLKQIAEPLPDVKAGSELSDNKMDVPNMRGGQQGGALKREARLIDPSGDPEVFKVVSLVLGTPEFQRQ